MGTGLTRRIAIHGIGSRSGLSRLTDTAPAIATMPNLSRADFIIRATDVASGGIVNATVTDTGFTSASQTINITYNGPADSTGATSDKLIIEILGNKFMNP